MITASDLPLLAQFFQTLPYPAVIVDLETTGGHLDNDRITEIALLRFADGKFTQHQWLVNPQMPIQPFVQKLTGISDSMVADAPDFSTLSGELLPLLRGSILLAHNSKFDYGFLCRAFARANIPFAAFSLCTVQLSRKLYPQYPRHNLDCIIERCGIPVESRHRAMSDVAAVALFLEQALQQHDAHTLRAAVHTLVHPALPAEPLPENLQTALFQLSDDHGFGVWYAQDGQPVYASTYRQTFHEALREYGHHRRAMLSEAADFRFIPTFGPLHALQLKAQYSVFRQPEATGRFTVQFHADAHGCLQARVVEICSGIQESPVYGMFRHKKAAKRALLEWAAQYQLCPESLDILPTTYPRNQPCPMQAAGLCDDNCQSEDGIRRQNERILQYASQLPVDGWGKAHTVHITEHRNNGSSITLQCRHGFLELPDKRLYFDNTLPEHLKSAFKQGRNAVTVID